MHHRSILLHKLCKNRSVSLAQAQKPFTNILAVTEEIETETCSLPEERVENIDNEREPEQTEKVKEKPKETVKIERRMTKRERFDELYAESGRGRMVSLQAVGLFERTLEGEQRRAQIPLEGGRTYLRVPSTFQRKVEKGGNFTKITREKGVKHCNFVKNMLQ